MNTEIALCGQRDMALFGDFESLLQEPKTTRYCFLNGLTQYRENWGSEKSQRNGHLMNPCTTSKTLTVSSEHVASINPKQS